MTRLSIVVRQLIICSAAGLTGPPIMVLFGGNRQWLLIMPIFVSSVVYANCIGVPAGLVLPFVARRIGKPGLKLSLALAASILALAAAGCFAGGVFLVAIGVHPAEEFWRVYFLTVRIGGTLALIFGMGSYFYESVAAQLRESRVRLQQQELEQERSRKLALEASLASLESRIHPHFLFNTLNSISALIPVDPERAEVIVGQLATLLRSSLDTTRQRLIPLEAELQIVRDYLDIEKARFGERLCYSFALPPEIKGSLVPPLAVQSLVENAVKHGVAPRAGGGEIQVVGTEDATRLRVEVRDNGPGFDLASVAAGHGLENLVSRLDALFGAAANLEVARRDGWCVVTLVVPLTRAEALVS